eukprot:comp63180_c0_seq1/m.47943 comp63180_c0_seq1/g.47943  ORF comp63180_c0_seq1/g.47943 comp63180_c0_seq1/m.47943 type:complete len:141 (-) comp63180_c0_seq1:335-757(-)
MKFFTALFAVFALLIASVSGQGTILNGQVDPSINVLFNVFVFRPPGTVCPLTAFRVCGHCLPQGLFTPLTNSVYQCVIQCGTDANKQAQLIQGGCSRIPCLRALQRVCGQCLVQSTGSGVARCAIDCWNRNAAQMRSLGC